MKCLLIYYLKNKRIFNTNLYLLERIAKFVNEICFICNPNIDTTSI